VSKQKFQWALILYYCELLGLAIVIGGLLMIIAAVIPAVFNSFGMEPAGRFLRRVFDGYTQICMGVVIFLFGMAAIRVWQSKGSTGIGFPVSTFEAILLGSMGCITVLIMWVLGPQTVALQELAFETTTELEKKAAYNNFFRLHMVVRALHLANVGIAIGLFVFKLRKGLTERISF
jgi:hypothetical protein